MSGYNTSDPLNHVNNFSIDFSTDDYFKQFPYPTEFIKQKPLLEIIVKCIAYIVIISVALPGNLLVITAIARSKRLQASTNNLYILNLAVCDLLVTLMCMWVHLVDDVTDGWQLGAFFCRFNSFSQVCALVASVLTLTVISGYRFFGVVFAMRAAMTSSHTKVFISIIWLVAIAMASPLLLYREQMSRQWLDHNEIWCDDTWTTQMRRIYYTLTSIALYFLPCIIMSVAYIFIMVTLWSSKLPGEHIKSVERASRRRTKKAILMLLALLFAFIFCWSPLMISLLYAEHRSQHSTPLPVWYDKFQFAAVFLADCNSALNPIIYNAFNKGFVQSFICGRSGYGRRPSQQSGAGANLGYHHTRVYNTIELKRNMVTSGQQTTCTTRLL